ncbi:putative cytochrome b-c1 complex subunit 2, mitochondrial [Apostichopus japonicus]|uniref:Putative cytochrome b-c1 complex subunit 2, mitochondrial n=1 Tax=Stichopus japonicus TaxID=307972 RepID=A0A2G8K9B2_STIJA|nr:putative cytochrome b-c1 complex subunit 2, mitochondrial [Apostichopus japonicus]
MSLSGVRPAVSRIARRCYSAQASATRKSEEGAILPKQDVVVSKLANGLTVASLDNYSPVSKVSVVVNAGSRYETSENLGITHCLRTFANLTSKGASSFSISRGLEDIGASLEATTTKEHMIYTVQCLRDNLDTACHYLTAVTTGQEFRDWEVKDNKIRLKMDLAVRNNDLIADVIEGLHSAAFRSSLGKSLYAPEFMIPSISPQSLHDFVDGHFLAGNMALVGVGVDHDDLRAFGDKMPLKEGGVVQKVPAKFHGGQQSRNPTSSALAFAAIGVEGTSLSSKDLLTAGVLQHLMGVGQHVKWGSNVASSRLNQSAAQVTSLPSSTNCFNLAYTDAGIFGVCAITQSQDMNPILKSVMGVFRAATKGNIDSKDFQRAKNQLKSSLLMKYENQETILEDIAIQALATGGFKPISEVVADIDAITADDAVRLAKKMFNGKPSMAVSGNLSNTSYLEELMSA